MQYQGYRPQQPANNHHSRRPNKRALLAVLAAIAVAILLIWGVANRNSGNNADLRQLYKASRNTFLDHIYVDGISLAGMTYDEAFETVMQRVQTWQNSWSLSVSCAGHTYATLNYPAIGINLNEDQLDTVLKEAWAYGHQGDYEQFCLDVQLLTEQPFQAELVQSQGSSSQLDYVLKVIDDTVYRAPKNAEILSFDPSIPASPFTFSAEVYGQAIDIEAAKAEILHRAAIGESGEYDVPLLPIEPDITLAECKQSVSLLSQATTAIDKHSTAERNANIALAFDAINGRVLQNGDRLSFNKLVGKRSVENGYKTALGYVSGELTETIGGGVCQASTTLYSAALCAGMSIRSRTPHAIPVSYISLGQDATVNDMRGHEIDLTFKNETGSTVYITCGIEENAAGRLQCAVYFYGQASPNGEYHKLESVITEKLPIPEDVIREDKEAKYVTYIDEKHKVSSGAEGYVVKTYLQTYVDGSVVDSKLISTDTYRARGAIYYVGVQKRQ